MDNVKSAIQKLSDATRRGRLMRREANSNVLELSKELNEVNMNLQAVFMQLRYVKVSALYTSACHTNELVS